MHYLVRSIGLMVGSLLGRWLPGRSRRLYLSHLASELSWHIGLCAAYSEFAVVAEEKWVPMALIVD